MLLESLAFVLCEKQPDTSQTQDPQEVMAFSLVVELWGPVTGSLQITTCQGETDLGSRYPGCGPGWDYPGPDQFVGLGEGLLASCQGSRGLVQPGLKADINVIDFDALQLKTPHVVHDLPAGGLRFLQNADGIDATIVTGEVIYEKGEATGALPGKLVRGSQQDPRAATA